MSVRAVRVIFDAVIRAEEANTAHEELSGLKWTAYLAISTVYAAALMACLVSLIGTTSAGQWISGVGGGLSSLVVLALILMALGLVIAVCSSRAARVVAPLACLTWTVVMGWQLSGGYGDWKQAVLSALIAVVVGLFVLEGILGNVGYLHGVPIGWTMLSTAVPCALVAGSTVAWLTGPALWSSSAVTSVPLALISLVIGATACVSLPWLAARTLPGARSIRQYGLATTPIDGVLQDCFLVTSLSIIITWVPNLFMAHLDDGAAWWNTIPPFFALFSATYMYVMKNNIGHVHRERRRIDGLAGKPMSTDAQRMLEALAKHIQRQNRIALIALIPLGLPALFNEITGFDKGDLKQIINVSSQSQT